MPPERFTDRQVRLLLTRDPENRQVVAYTAGNHAWEHMHEDEKYEKFAYSTQFAFSVAKEDNALNRGAYDSMLALRAGEKDLWHVRSGCESFGGSGGFLLVADERGDDRYRYRPTGDVACAEACDPDGDFPGGGGGRLRCAEGLGREAALRPDHEPDPGRRALRVGGR